jgi:hypothetical protein
MCEVDAALFVVEPSFVRWLLETCTLFLLAFAAACAELAFAFYLC